jgi:hypothetical protein
MKLQNELLALEFFVHTCFVNQVLWLLVVLFFFFKGVFSEHLYFSPWEMTKA